MRTLFKPVIGIAIFACCTWTVFTAFSDVANKDPEDPDWVKKVGARKTPSSKKIYWVNDFGTVNDSAKVITKIIQQAIDKCAKDGGGIVAFKPGTYLTGSIFLKSNVHLKIDKGVLIKGSQNFDDYPDIDTRVAGIEMKWPAALINAIGQQNVLISGEGKINAQGKFCWDKYWAMRREYEPKGLRWIVDYDAKRVRTILVQSCSDVTLKGLTISNAGFWTVQLLYSDHLTVDGLTIKNNEDGKGPSTDGIDIDSSSWVLVENCDIDCNDDDFCLKAGRDADGLRVNRPTEYVVIRKCIARKGGGLLTLGSETSGGIRHVLATDLVAMGTGNGFHIKSATTRGGTVEDIHFRNIQMDSVGNAFMYTMNWNPTYSYSSLPPGYNYDSLPIHWKVMLTKVEPAEKGIPHFKDIYVSNITVKYARKAINAAGLEQSLLENFNFQDVKMNAGTAGDISHAGNWQLKNVTITTADGSKVNVKNSKAVALATQAQRPMEMLDRGVVAVRNKEGHAFVSWRLLGTEPAALSFNVYRTLNGKTVKLNKTPVKDVTHFVDTNIDSTKQASYFVKTIGKGKEGAASRPFILKASNAPYFSIPLQTPAGYNVNDGSVGDLDGDGVYEFVLHMAGRGRDNSQAGITDPPIFQAYKMDGTLLWTINLGRNIREGAHYTQFMVYDFDGDGRAEVAMKTADGTIDSKGKVIGDSSRDYRNAQGYILSGPEYLTVFDGLTGVALHTVDFIPPRHAKLEPTTQELKDVWGDGYGNRCDRFLGAVAYLDGKTPSIIMSRGYYTRTVIAAWNFKGGKIIKQWVFDSDDPANPANRAYRGQGNHNLSVADVDHDGRDEIVFGAMTLDDNGKGLYSTGLGHGDALHVSDLDPSRPGLEVFDIQERFDDAGANFRDARTGEVIWKIASVKAGDDGEGPGRGLSLDVDPRYPGYECWVAGAGITGMFNVKGEKIAERTPSVNYGIYWDGDVLSEVLNGHTIDKWNYLESKTEPLLNAAEFGCVSNNGTKRNPVLSADILGDWREELIVRTADNKELRIFVTSIPTDRKFYTLMHDPHYRLSIAWQNVAYNQPPHTGFFMGEGMATPPKPDIVLIQPSKKADTALK